MVVLEKYVAVKYPEQIESDPADLAKMNACADSLRLNRL